MSVRGDISGHLKHTEIVDDRKVEARVGDAGSADSGSHDREMIEPAEFLQTFDMVEVFMGQKNLFRTKIALAKKIPDLREIARVYDENTTCFFQKVGILGCDQVRNAVDIHGLYVLSSVIEQMSLFQQIS